MADIPLLFRAEMVRALLEGRKAQTRRPAWRVKIVRGEGMVSGHRDGAPTAAQRIRVGDRIWVKETNALVGGCDPGLFVTRADYPQCVPREYENVPPAAAVRWTPSIHMKRIYSRLTLIVTGARIERLQDISEADAIAEGCRGCLGPNPDFPDEWDPSPEEEYADLYERIHGKGAWEDNPEVVVLTFTVHKANIDITPAGIKALEGE